MKINLVAATNLNSKRRTKKIIFQKFNISYRKMCVAKRFCSNRNILKIKQLIHIMIVFSIYHLKLRTLLPFRYSLEHFLFNEYIGAHSIKKKEIMLGNINDQLNNKEYPLFSSNQKKKLEQKLKGSNFSLDPNANTSKAIDKSSFKLHISFINAHVNSKHALYFLFPFLFPFLFTEQKHIKC